MYKWNVKNFTTRLQAIGMAIIVDCCALAVINTVFSSVVEMEIASTSLGKTAICMKYITEYNLKMDEVQSTEMIPMGNRDKVGLDQRQPVLW